MDRSVLILILVVTVTLTLVQINASAFLPDNEHQREKNTSENKPPTIKHHREHRPKSHGTAETAEKKKPHELEATNRGHWEWVPDPPQNNPYMIQPPIVAPAALSTMQPMYSFYPIPMWPSPGIPTFLPAPVQLSATTNQPQHDHASENHLEKNRKMPERRAHRRSHRNSSKNHEPSKSGPKHTQSTSQHRKSEVEVPTGDKFVHDRNKNEQKLNPKRIHSTNIPGSVRNDETVNRESRVHSKIDSGIGNEGGSNIGQGPGQIGNAESEPKNTEKVEHQKSPSTSRNSGGAKTTRT